MNKIRKKPTGVLDKYGIVNKQTLEHEHSVAIALWDRVNALVEIMHNQDLVAQDRELAQTYKVLREVEESGWSRD